jgi:hypothetical protein
LILVGYYLLNENIILNKPESLKYFIVACSSEYILVWELVKLLEKSQELAIYHTIYVYFGLILLQLGLYQRLPIVIQWLIKISFGFCFGYLFTNIFLLNYNFIRNLVSLVISIAVNYFDILTLNYMTLTCTHFIYFITVFEGINILTSLIPIENIYIRAAVCCFCGVLVSYIYISTFITRLGDLNNNDSNRNLEGEKFSDIV